MPTDATCAVQIGLPSDWLSATIEPSCWPVNNMPPPSAIPREVLRPRENAGFDGGFGLMPSYAQMMLPVAGSSAATPVGVGMYIVPLRAVAADSAPIAEVAAGPQ